MIRTAVCSHRNPLLQLSTMNTPAPSLSVLASVCALAATLPAQDYVSRGTIPTNYASFPGYFAADLDGNGVKDLILDAFNNGVSVWLNPSFGAAMATTSFEIDVSAIDPFGGWFDIKGIIDVDGDGNLDVAGKFSGIGIPQMVYCAGDGMGGFGPPITINTLQGAILFGDYGDFDGDGLMDAVSTNIPFFGQGPSNLVFYTQATGSFALAHTEPQTDVQQVFAGDFDGDGFDDAVWTQRGPTLEILPGGANGFGQRQSMPLPAELDGGFVLDLDKDGYEDLILQDLIGSSTNAWQVHVLWGSATGLSSPQVVVPPGSGFVSSEYVGPFDIEGDGNPELLFVIRNTNGFVLVRHDGARNFSPQPYETDTFGGQIDLDGDGDLDQVVADPIAGVFELRENIASYGVACAGAMGEPTLSVGAAIPGSTTFAMTLTNAAPNAPAQIFLSAAPVAGPCGPQIDFAQMLIPAANDPLFLGMTDAAGQLALPLNIPSQLPPGPYFFQGVVLDAAGAFQVLGYDLSATRGRAVRVY